MAHHPMPRNPHARHHVPLLPRKGAHVHFSSAEAAAIAVSMVTLILAFHMFKVSDTGIILGIVAGVTLHEVVHKLVAQSMGFESRYKLWELGLVLVVAFAIITKGRFIFAAPGFVVTEGEATAAERGKISLSAPATNLVLVLLFFGMGGIWRSAAYVNALLGVFNLLPIPPLDGATVREWSSGIWSAAFGLALALAIFMIF